MRVPIEVTVDAGARLSGAGVVGEVAAAAARLAIEGRLGRVKICPADDCRWAFYDRSKNHSRQWCSMEVCGNRAKVRNHRERSAST
ncbi:CGNR zinc finger domain-containing protein [Mumia sp. zg.B53]|nr:CGNR zinc finger domain-containing protein [Mumia sp. zg.B17]MBW9215263.1 CGNR zinc finger domain-containing protein [Mumia sp. zg.B53]